MIQDDQLEMYRERIKWVGISLSDRKDGPFSLEIDWIKAMNTEYTMGDLDNLTPKQVEEKEVK